MAEPEQLRKPSGNSDDRAVAGHGTDDPSVEQPIADGATPMPGGARGRPLPADVLRIQRTLGNAHVARLLGSGPRVGPSGGSVPDVVASTIQQRQGGGSELDNALRTRMEAGFGTNFGDVRIHSDAASADLNTQLGAHAFTTGSDIFLGGDTSTSDEHTVAHELTHVVQQRTMSSSGPLTVGAANDPLEHEAADTAARVLSGATAAPVGAADAPTVGRVVIQRVDNPYAGTDNEAAWQRGYDDGLATPNASLVPPADYTPDQVRAYTEGVAAAQPGASTAGAAPPGGAPAPAAATSSPAPAAATSSSASSSLSTDLPISFAGVVFGSPLTGPPELLPPGAFQIPEALMELPAIGGATAGAGTAAAGTTTAVVAEEALLVAGTAAIETTAVTEAVAAITILGISLTPVGWIILGSALVIVAAGAATGAYYAFRTDKTAKPAPNNGPAQLPGQSNGPPVVDPNTPAPATAPGAGPATPVVDPNASSNGPMSLPGQPSSGPVSAATLEQEYAQAVINNDWATAAEKLNGFSLDDILARLSQLTDAQVRSIHLGALANPRVGPNSQVGQVSDVDQRTELAEDPAVGRSRPNERDTALRVQQSRGIRLGRFTPGPGEKGDWQDPVSGDVYDGCSPPRSQFFDRQISNGNYEQSLVDHLTHPTVNFVVIDITGLGLTPAQLQVLDALIARVAGANIAKIVRIP